MHGDAGLAAPQPESIVGFPGRFTLGWGLRQIMPKKKPDLSPPGRLHLRNGTLAAPLAIWAIGAVLRIAHSG
jgi:hypothetical protein